MADEYRLNVESSHLLEIFPEEIWDSILKLMDDPEVENLSNSSQYFRKLLATKRTLLLFPKVWEVFGEQLERLEIVAYRERDEPASSNNESITCESCDSERCEEYYSGILKLRLVCRKWNNVIDALYQAAPNVFKFGTDNANIFKDLWRVDLFDGQEDESERIVCFRDHFQNSHGNVGMDRSPFLSRSMKVTRDFYLDSDGYILDQEEYFEGIREVLQKYGHHLWYFNIDTMFDMDTAEECYEQLCQWLGLMPNLKTLELSAFREEFEMTPEAVCSPYPNPLSKSLVAMRLAITLMQLPVMENLEYLIIDTSSPDLFDQFIRRNGHVSAIKIKNINKYDDNHFNIFQVQLNNLRELSITINSVETLLEFANPSVQWSLNKLNLDLDLTDWLEWRRVFTMLEKWTKTLTHLALKLPVEDEPENHTEDSVPSELNMLHIRHLELTIPTGSDLDFIFPVKNTLVYLQVKFYSERDVQAKPKIMKRGEPATTISILSSFRKPMEPCFWKMFPKLKQLGHFQ